MLQKGATDRAVGVSEDKDLKVKVKVKVKVLTTGSAGGQQGKQRCGGVSR